MWQAIIWTKADRVYRPIYAALGLDDLIAQKPPQYAGTFIENIPKLLFLLWKLVYFD